MHQCFFLKQTENQQTPSSLYKLSALLIYNELLPCHAIYQQVSDFLLQKLYICKISQRIIKGIKYFITCFNLKFFL